MQHVLCTCVSREVPTCLHKNQEFQEEWKGPINQQSSYRPGVFMEHRFATWENLVEYCFLASWLLNINAIACVLSQMAWMY